MCSEQTFLLKIFFIVGTIQIHTVNHKINIKHTKITQLIQIIKMMTLLFSNHYCQQLLTAAKFELRRTSFKAFSKRWLWNASCESFHKHLDKREHPAHTNR